MKTARCIRSACPSWLPVWVILAMTASIMPARAQLRIFIDTLDATAFPVVRDKVRVLDGNAAVRGLTITNFTIQEDNIIQAPITGYCEDTVQAEPASVLLVIDRSGSMDSSASGYPLADAKRAAQSFVDRLTPNDECAVISFASSVAYDQGWTNDKTLLKNSIGKLKPGMQTVLWDAFYSGAAMMQTRVKKRAMVALTDGTDNGSNHTYQQAMTAVVNAKTVVYTIGLGNQMNPAQLQNIANATKGKYYGAQTSADLDEIYNLISKEISTTGLCEVRYTSKLDCLDGSTHRVRVTVTVGGDNEYAEADFTLPYNPSTFSSVTLSMGTDYSVDQSAALSVPIELTKVSTNRPPRSFQFDLRYNRALIHLDSVSATALSKNYTISHQPTTLGSSITLRGTAPITTTGLLLSCHFRAAAMEESAKARITVTPPDVQQFCTEATAQDGIITINGSCERAVRQAASGPAMQTRILPNVPNPFNPTTRIRYSVGRTDRVSLTLFDAIGRRMRTLVEERQEAGEYHVVLDGSLLANGIYYLQLRVGSDTDMRQIALVK
jgi:VWFA-related protein